jgi:AIR synthase-related protein
MTLDELASTLREGRGIAHKRDIRAVRALLGDAVCAKAGLSSPERIRLGDDCAAIPDGDGHLLFAIEGLLDEFVTAEPWFAGYCGIMVNVSDIFAMGGRPIAVVDALWGSGGTREGTIWEGMKAASEKYGVPIVGGHTNSRSTSEHLAVAVLGRANKLLTSFDARPGDVFLAAIDLRGEYFDPYPYWNASTSAPAQRLRTDLEILPGLAEDGLCRAAKDISMGGVIGTLLMLAESSGVGATLNVSAVPRPRGVPLDKWLVSFPSFGFLLAVPAALVETVRYRFLERQIACTAVGRCNQTHIVTLTDGSQSVGFWDFTEQPLMGFGAAVPEVAR